MASLGSRDKVQGNYTAFGGHHDQLCSQNHDAPADGEHAGVAQMKGSAGCTALDPWACRTGSTGAWAACPGIRGPLMKRCS